MERVSWSSAMHLVVSQSSPGEWRGRVLTLTYKSSDLMKDGTVQNQEACQFQDQINRGKLSMNVKAPKEIILNERNKMKCFP